MTEAVEVSGDHTVPGDKSISHRALMLAALAPGDSAVDGLLESLDVRSTASVLRSLGATISPIGDGRKVRIHGVTQFRDPELPLDCGNSGTTARLMAGLLAAQPITSRLTGDASLSRRPMRRVTDPLSLMGATVVFEGEADGLPLSIAGGELRSLQWTLPVASAQIKSALLLAGMAARVPVSLRQPGESRDHTERALIRHGFHIHKVGDLLEFDPAAGRLEPGQTSVPGDPSSAAFLAAAALLAARGQILVRRVCCNPTRIGFIPILLRMGARISQESIELVGGEPVGDLLVSAGGLVATNVAVDEVPAAIDEMPILAVLASRAVGLSRFEGLAELRHKESNRLELMAANLRAVGVSAEVEGDALLVEGNDRPLSGRIITGGDHRIAMSFAVLSMASGGGIEIDDPDCADVSYPGFGAALAGLRQ